MYFINHPFIYILLDYFFFLGRVPHQVAKIVPVPPNRLPSPLFDQSLSTQLSFVPKNFKNFTSFSLNFDYFLAQNCIRKCYFMLKNTKICWIFCCRRAFLASADKSPLIWLCPRRESPLLTPSLTGTEKSSPKASPPTQYFVKNPVHMNTDKPSIGSVVL